MANTLTSPSYPPSIGNGGNQRLALDNLIRRELKVGDPNDASQIAQALLTRYRDDPRARAIAQESQGLPFLQTRSAAAPSAQQRTATGLDLEQAIADVNMDLHELIGNNLAKDVVPELEGWAQSIRSAIQQGVSAAQFGMDARNRDKAFAVRRQLGDYARLSRLVGALTPALNADYRNLAQSLDEVSSVILVMMGEALANSGFAGGRYLLQAPFSELQARRDAVLYALRNLTGATQQAFGPNEWPRGIDAYRQLFRMLEERGHGELRSLLGENELAQSMDELIQLAGNGAATGLRALGATAWAQLNRFVRFVQLSVRSVSPQSPPLTAFVEALQMFIDGFSSAGGFRLLRVARPPVLFYGLYGSDEVSNADQRLIQLVINRGAIAVQLDCLTRCRCDKRAVKAQIVGDKLLYDIDRAIDLYCIGEQDLGIPEVRASAYSYVIDAAIETKSYGRTSLLFSLFNNSSELLRPHQRPHPLWGTTYDTYEQYRRTVNGGATVLHQELCMQQLTDQDLRPIVEQMTSNCIPLSDIFDPSQGWLTNVSDRAIKLACAGTSLANQPCTLRQPSLPTDIATAIGAAVFDGSEAG